MFKINNLIIFFALLVSSAATWAQKDAALVTTLAGDATYQATGSVAVPVQTFMKLREGDRAEVKANARLQLVYLETGEVEQWDGPAAFTVGAQRTLAITSGKPVTRKLPPSMVERLARTPAVMSDIRNRSGLSVTRAVRPVSPKVAAARETYAQARQELPQDDISPELDLLMVLYEERYFDQANEVLQEMQRRAPDDMGVREIADRFRKLRGR
jgi:hypothetical protein